MCVQLMAIKSRLSSAPKSAVIPCGKCEECRDSLKNQWSFRLRCELENCRRAKWHIGFFTLTYNDENLPHIDSLEGKSFPCFSRKHVRTFIDNIRKRVNERYSFSGLRYMVCSEYGDNTKRPHYHGLICFPPSIPPKDMFELIKSNWCNKGFVFPRDIRGGIDTHGYRHKPFLLDGSIVGAARYAAKYCCKDLNWYSLVGSSDFDIEDLKDAKPFHIQSRSIGLSYLSSLPADKLIDYLKNGVSFIGDSKRVPLPLYLKNKILFTPKYEFVECPSGDWWYDFECNKWRYKKGAGTHARKVMREPNNFFKDNVKQVFEQKCVYYADLFTQMSNADFWSSRHVDKNFSLSIPAVFSAYMKKYHFSVGTLSRFYVAYYGVPFDKCFNAPLELCFLSRYSDVDFGRCMNVNTNVLYHLKKVIDFLMGSLSFSQTKDIAKRKRLARLLDLYKSME